MTGEPVGVVVIGRNEGERLVRCLRSLAHTADRLVYVDSGSTDGSVAAAVRAGARIVELDMSRPFTAARARNAGYDALKAQDPGLGFVQFVDGDCEVDRDWIATAAAFLQKRPDVAVVCGRRRERYPDASIYNRLCDDEWATPVGQAQACGGDSLVRTRAFDAVDGFNPALIAGEEPELCARLRQSGWKIWRIDAEMTLHDAAMMRLGEWWRRNVRAGFGFAQGLWLHRQSSHAIWRREVWRAILWAGLLPALILAGTLLHPVALFGIALYPLQILRIALRREGPTARAWAYAFFVMLSKWPELQGIVRFHLHRLRGHVAGLIEYK